MKKVPEWKRLFDLCYFNMRQIKRETSKIDCLLREWYSKPNQIRFWDWESQRKKNKRTTRSNNRYVKWMCVCVLRELERKNQRIYLNLTKCCSTNNKKHDISMLVIVYRSEQTNWLARRQASKRKNENYTRQTKQQPEQIQTETHTHETVVFD